ncbi:NAD(P)-binding protein [Sarocladium strictum]
MSTEATARQFFSSARFAVVGASTNPAKFGHKIFAWYIAHGLDVTPINPAGAALTVDGKEYPAVKDLTEMSDPKNTSVSVVTGPSVSVGVLNKAKELGFPSVWLQPDTFNDEVLKLAREDGAFQAVVAGEGGRGSEGWCVLVDGAKALKGVGKL